MIPTKFTERPLLINDEFKQVITTQLSVLYDEEENKNKTKDPAGVFWT